MSLPVNTVASGGLPVVDVTALAAALQKCGMPVSEAAAGMGVAVTKVISGGTPVIFVSPPP